MKEINDLSLEETLPLMAEKATFERCFKVRKCMHMYIALDALIKYNSASGCVIKCYGASGYVFLRISISRSKAICHRCNHDYYHAYLLDYDLFLFAKDDEQAFH